LLMLNENGVWEIDGPAGFPTNGDWIGPNGYQQMLIEFGKAGLNETSYSVNNQTTWGVKNNAVMVFGESSGFYSNCSSCHWRMPWSQYWQVMDGIWRINTVFTIIPTTAVSAAAALSGSKSNSRSLNDFDLKFPLSNAIGYGPAIDVVAKAYAFLGNGSIAQFLSCMSDDIVWTVDCPPSVHGAGGVWHGHLGLLGYLAAFGLSPYSLKYNQPTTSPDQWLVSSYGPPGGYGSVMLRVLSSGVIKGSQQQWQAPTANWWQVGADGLISAGYDLWTIENSD